MTKWLMILALLLAAAAHAAPVMVVDSQPEYWLPIDANGWTVLPEATVDTLEIYVSSSTGNDTTGDGTIETPYATIAKAITLFRNSTQWVQQPAIDPIATPTVGYAYCTPDDVIWYGDRVYLKCGDTWDEDISLRRGADDDPMVWASYGSGNRPIVNGFSQSGSDSHLTGRNIVIGIQFSEGLYIRNTYLNAEGYWDTWDKGCKVLIEDCVLFTTGIKKTDQVVIRRTMVLDAYSETGDSTGIYLESCSSSMVEDSVIDHCGWHDTIIDAEPTTRNHNLYIKEDCLSFLFRNCITARASLTGAQLRAGGDCIDNLFIENPATLSWGYVVGSPITVGGVTGEITNNVVLGDADICRPRPYDEESPYAYWGMPMGRGIAIGNVASGTCSGNIVSTRITEPINNNFIQLDADMSNNNIAWENGAENIGINSLTISRNIAYGWEGGFDFTDGTYNNVVISNNAIQDGSLTTYLAYDLGADYSEGAVSLQDNRYYAGTLTNAWYVSGGATNWAGWISASGETGSNEQVTYADPTRSIATYMASLGYAEGDQTVDKFLELARANSKADWDTDFTADAVNDYIRAGFEE